MTLKEVAKKKRYDAEEDGTVGFTALGSAERFASMARKEGIWVEVFEKVGEDGEKEFLVKEVKRGKDDKVDGK